MPKCLAANAESSSSREPRSFAVSSFKIFTPTTTPLHPPLLQRGQLGGRGGGGVEWSLYVIHGQLCEGVVMDLVLLRADLLINLPMLLMTHCC